MLAYKFNKRAGKDTPVVRTARNFKGNVICVIHLRGRVWEVNAKDLTTKLCALLVKEEKAYELF